MSYARPERRAAAGLRLNARLQLTAPRKEEAVPTADAAKLRNKNHGS